MADKPSQRTDMWSLNEEIVNCRLCPRLVSWREEIAAVKKKAFNDCTYWGKPVPGFGDENPRLLIVGLAPGAHGSNRTGRMFTGDASGSFLFTALHRAGFASKPISLSMDDDLRLKDVFITALARCAPPGNKPTTEEFRNCRKYLIREIALFDNLEGIVALGALAYQHVLEIYRLSGYRGNHPAFGHGVMTHFDEGGPWVLASYHPSRQNTQTGRLTQEMFGQIWEKAEDLLNG